VAAKKTKDVLEMFGDFLRDASVLFLIFAPLEAFMKDEKLVTFQFLMLVFTTSLLLFVLGIICEKNRS